MMNNIHSDELDKMREQFQLLHAKLEEQSIVNDSLVRKIVNSKVESINKSAWAISVMALVGIPYCLWVFLYLLHTSMAFALVTVLFLAVAVGYNYFTYKGFKTSQIVSLPLAEIARRTIRMKRRYARWLCFSLPFLAVWILWFSYEVLNLIHVSADERNGLLIGGGVGLILGGLLGLIAYRKNQRLAREILEQVEERHPIA